MLVSVRAYSRQSMELGSNSDRLALLQSLLAVPGIDDGPLAFAGLSI